MQKDENLYLRTVEKDDMELLFRWANDAAVRNNSFSPEPISLETHIKWFKGMMEDPSVMQYILMCNDSPIGQIRFSLSDDKTQAETDYSIDPGERGKGYGSRLIELGIRRLKEDVPDLKKIIGKVKEGNTASETCFKKNGFFVKYKHLETDCGD